MYWTLVVFACLLVYVNAQDRSVCFSGSSMYQQLTVDCSSQNPSYNGTWFCAKVEVCEFDISKSRSCIVTKGCATESQCINSTSYYNGQHPLEMNGQLPGGMQIKVSCCQALSVANDDTVTINYNNICNTATSTLFSYSKTCIISIIVMVMIGLQWII